MLNFQGYRNFNVLEHNANNIEVNYGGPFEPMMINVELTEYQLNALRIEKICESIQEPTIKKKPDLDVLSVAYNDRTVIMHFSDGTYTKAVCTENDVFNLDYGIMVCLLRKMTDDSKEHKTYKKMMRDIRKMATEIVQKPKKKKKDISDETEVKDP